jgi:tetratricopeptide (TPR) repeat protein
MPHLLRTISEYDKLSPADNPIRFPRELACTLLSASRFLDKAWKLEAVERAKDLLVGDSDPYMNAYVTSRSSSVFRMFNMRDKSSQVLQNFVHMTVLLGHDHDSESDSRYNSKRSELLVSHAKNLLRGGQLKEAETELSEWTPLDPENPSTLEKTASRVRDTVLGRALWYQGRFREALELMEKVFENSRFDEHFEGTNSSRVLLSGVVELYSVLGRKEEARALLETELQSMRDSGTQDLSAERSLQRALAEAYLGKDMFSEAEEIFLRLKDQNEMETKPGPPCTLRLFRIWVCLAIVAHGQSQWAKALERWSEALETAERVNFDEGFNTGLVKYSMSYALLKSGDKTKSNQLLEEGQANMRSEACVFWFPFFQSQWQRHIAKAMEAEGV